jgi:AcrR family transcriptional regulator
MVESRREANKRKSRQKILKASRRLFKENGYENTMIEEVAAKAEVSKATLYNYFPNKDSLLVGTMDDVTESFEKFIRGFDSHMKADEKIYMAMKFLILDSIPFVGISRRILFLNGCRDSEMFGKANTIKNIFDIMVKQAQEEGIFKSELTDKDIVDELMGVYLISQFQWTDLETMTEEECVQRIERLLDLTLAGCYVNK